LTGTGSNLSSGSRNRNFFLGPARNQNQKTLELSGTGIFGETLINMYLEDTEIYKSVLIYFFYPFLKKTKY